ncbi:TonB-dependent receptor [Fulvivirga sp. M361]|uniref:TonB-dependent receptor n=1 Tax=Fulvivirga sp. M361 TaxID=2594266 RepID=UPI001179C98F|nr:TonB-dependent receptor [Fulvivirga sp. M361]TRX61762.1 TonB-dependent receptor [Fulvivirga sp. M361]
MKTKLRLGLVIFLLPCSVVFAQKYSISGYVKEKGSGELLPGVTVYLPDLKTGAVTNTYGFYSLTLAGNETYDVQYSFIGYEPISKRLNLNENKSINIELTASAIALEEVVVMAEQQELISEKSQMSVVSLPTRKIQDFPSFLGEKDVMKTLQLMPGVQSGSEGSSGLYVRGGGPDQNLIILDEAVVYNASHLFGFFSVFNGDALKSVELYKGGFPPRFGGRLSSVVKMDMKDGNKEEVHGKVGIGLLSSSFMLEGPIKKGKTSFLVSGRRTYLDVLAAPFIKASSDGEASGGYYFYDLNTKINHEFSSRDKLYVSGYFGRDKFYAKEKYEDSKFNAGLGWGNATGTLRWNHQFNDKLFANSSLIFSRYSFDISADEEDRDFDYKLKYSSGITDYSAKFDLDFFPNPSHSLRFGLLTTHHSFTPRALVLRETGIEPKDEQDKFNSIETAVYAEDDMRLFNRLNILLGLRLSHFNYKNTQYFKPEPRLSMAYMLNDKLSVKASYASMNQYIHLLTNSGIGLPTDLWVSSTDKVKPQSSRQVAIGLAKDFNSRHGLSLTIEGYYKKSDDVIAYKEGATFLVLDDPESAENVNWEDNITAGQSWAYGAEVFLEKKLGKFTGWLGYTLSKTELQFDELNLGEKYFAKYDRRHDVSLVGVFKPSNKITLSGTWVYGTGNNFTVPTGTFRVAQEKLSHSFFFEPEFDDIEQINNFRAEAYHRLDFGIQFHKKKKRGIRTWDIGIYNIYNRRNPFFYYTESKTVPQGEKIALKKVSILPVIPSISYRLEF